MMLKLQFDELDSRMGPLIIQSGVGRKTADQLGLKLGALVKTEINPSANPDERRLIIDRKCLLTATGTLPLSKRYKGKLVPLKERRRLVLVGPSHCH